MVWASGPQMQKLQVSEVRKILICLSQTLDFKLLI